MLRERLPRALAIALLALCAVTAATPGCASGGGGDGNRGGDAGPTDARPTDARLGVDGATACTAAGTCSAPREVCRGGLCIDRDLDLDGDGVTAMLDCDEMDPGVHPGATEACDGADQDCDTRIDEGTTLTTFYADADGDAFGVEATTVMACAAPDGHAEEAGDCDDARPSVHPGAPEVCNGADDDCDDAVDEGGCPDGCVGGVHIAHSYLFCSGARSHAAAAAHCATGGMRLVRVDDTSENDYVRNTATGLMLGDLWVGGSDEGTEGSWVWADDTQFWAGGPAGSAVGGRVARWATGEPSEAATADCARMNAGFVGDWAAVACGTALASVCEEW